ncbi:MAG: hypothetical protein H6812_11575 [Phycisphaeraceae bacterium]|nr:hypothetical protein [Phycisphaerales bacterium]MCB9843882.1 hypothetical protein [Phycisphaeraceae bacterium]
MRSMRFVLCSIGLLMTPTVAAAGAPDALIRWDAQGSFGLVLPGTSPPLSGLSFGDTVSVSMTFDPFAFAGTPIPLPTGQGAEYHINPALFSIDFPGLGLSLSAEELVGGTPEFIVSIADNTDAIHGIVEDIITVNVYRADGAANGTEGVQFTWAGFAPPSFFNGTEIPIQFGWNNFSGSQIVLSNASNNSFQGGGTLSSFTSTIVPAPASAAVLAMGLAVRRRRSN